MIHTQFDQSLSHLNYGPQIYWWDTYREGDRLQLILSVIPLQYSKDSKNVTLYNHLEFEIVTATDEVWAWGDNMYI